MTRQCLIYLEIGDTLGVVYVNNIRSLRMEINCHGTVPIHWCTFREQNLSPGILIRPSSATLRHTVLPKHKDE